MTLRTLALWAAQSAAVGALVAGVSWGLMGRCARPGSDAVVLKPLPEESSDRELADLAWSIRHEGVLDAINGTRPEPYVPADEEPRAREEPPVQPAQEEDAPAGADWAAPLTAVLKARPPKPASKRAALRMVSLGPPAQRIALGIPAPGTAAEAPASHREGAAQAEPPEEAPVRERRPSPIRSLSAPAGAPSPRLSGLAAQRGTVYEQADSEAEPE